MVYSAIVSIQVYNFGIFFRRDAMDVASNPVNKQELVVTDLEGGWGKQKFPVFREWMILCLCL